LELDTDCALSFIPAPSTTPGAAVEKRMTLEKRQANCPPPATEYFTLTSTNVITSTEIITETTTKTEEEEGFSCPPLTVTNFNGDVWELDEECSISVSLASPFTSPTGSASTKSTTSAKSGGTIPGITTATQLSGTHASYQRPGLIMELVIGTIISIMIIV
jgi:hypothetical protein